MPFFNVKFKTSTISIYLLVALTFFMAHLSCQPPIKPPSSIHEADEQDLKILAHINDLQREIRSQQNCSKSRVRVQQLEQWYNELEEIKYDYTELSPGTAFLGPISSVALVLKQRELQKRITSIKKQIYHN
ncbi:MAG: hypothetical protein AB7F19_07085 [Candidatus Babeliales bacterium]